MPPKQNPTMPMLSASTFGLALRYSTVALTSAMMSSFVSLPRCPIPSCI